MVVKGTYKVVGKMKPQAYVFVDHIDPAVDPHKGWQGYDVFIERLFVEKQDLQLLCKPCHDEKSMAEKQISKKRIKEEKKNGT